ncbi:TPA: magnesium transporter [bacterium]|nr:magnesium transporter [bacterium]
MYKIDFKQNDTKLKKELQKLHIADLAIVFENEDEEIQDRIYRLIDRKHMIKVIPELADEVVKKLFRRIPEKDITHILSALESDDLRNLLMLFNREEQQKYIKQLNVTDQDKILKLLSYDEEVAASLMSTDFISINKTMSIKEATHYVITTFDEKYYLDTIFITDLDNKLLGIIDIKDLIIARPNDDINEIMERKFYYVLEDTSIDFAISKIKDYDLKVLPVLNQENQILGIITSDDVLHYMEEEHISDYQAIVAVSDHSDELSPLKRSKQRIPWLLMSVIMNLVIASFLSVFQPTLEKVVALVFFQPMILGMAGNIGTQSLAVTILNINNQETRMDKHVLKEVFVALINSVLVGIISFGIVFLFLNYMTPSEYNAILIGIVVGLSLCGSMFISALASVFLPIILDKLGFDIAAASGPIISTINDFTALGIYFVIATLILII